MRKVDNNRETIGVCVPNAELKRVEACAGSGKCGGPVTLCLSAINFRGNDNEKNHDDLLRSCTAGFCWMWSEQTGSGPYSAV